MCVIITQPEGKIPSIKTLMECQQGNSDGIGLAWLTDKGVSFRKGIKFKHLIKLLVQVEVKKLPYVIHFRAATSGGVANRLCHPFPLVTDWEKLDALSGDGERAIMAHNGTWRDWKRHFPKKEINWLEAGNWSDSAIIAWLIAAGRDVSLPTQGYGNRIAFLSRKGGIKLWGEGWKEEEGISYSNTFWRYSANTTYYSSGYGYSRRNKDKDGNKADPNPYADFDFEDDWVAAAAAAGWGVGSQVGDGAHRSGRILLKDGSRRYVTQEGTSFCEGHNMFDVCWKTGGYTKAQALADKASGGACEIEAHRSGRAKVEVSATGESGVTRNYLNEGEVVVQTKIMRRVRVADHSSYLVDTGDRCFEKEPILLGTAAAGKRSLPVVISGNADDRAAVEMTAPKETKDDPKTKE
jgi:hypothetical protein